MRKFTRDKQAPKFLKEHGHKWRDAWVALREKSPAAKFNWAQLDNSKVNQLLLPFLKALTQHHCSFCDGYPVEGISAETIEHFRSKTRHPELAYAWENLYYACSCCQGEKLADEEELLLRPDDDAYCFRDYFYWDMESGTLQVNPRASEENQARAKVTIRLYGLNEHQRPTRRKEQRRRWLRQQEADETLDSWPYRDFLEQE